MTRLNVLQPWSSLTQGLRWLWVIVLLVVQLGLTPSVPSWAHDNGLKEPLAGAKLQGNVEIRGVAHYPQMLKWQLDLLPNGDSQQAIFLGLGLEAQPVAGLLANLNTSLYPDGSYVLRLRIVRQDGNYDTYATPITIANSQAPDHPPVATAVRGLAPRLGLPTHSLTGAPIVYLTFDDGPHPKTTPRIAEILSHYDAKATFFVVGRHVRWWPRALIPAARDGHEIANHTYSHRSLLAASPEQFSQEIESTEKVIQEAVGDILPENHTLRFLRAPYGATDAATYAEAAEMGYQVVAWDLDPKDWRQPGSDRIAAAVLDRVFPGAVVALHDGGGGSQQTVEALAIILEELSQRGYRFFSLGSQ
jgi:peptidoglycan/xylan/chitin deacetylase (PgdA/CDA1 family)